MPSGGFKSPIVIRTLGVISVVNSTTAALGISGVFTGIGEEVKDNAQITVFIKSDATSAINGLRLEFSTDNIVWDAADAYTITANSSKVFTLGPSARFFRVVYTNGLTAQTTFKIQTIYRFVRTKPSSHRINESIATEDDAELVKAVLTGEDNTNPGTFVNVQVDEQGRLLVSPGIISSTDILIRRYQRQVVTVHPTILTSYTVPAGKKFIMTSWHLQTASAITLTALEIDSVEVDALRFSNSANTNRQNVEFGAFGIEAAAGQVVQIETQTGDTSKEYIAGFTGIQSDV